MHSIVVGCIVLISPLSSSFCKQFADHLSFSLLDVRDGAKETLLML